MYCILIWKETWWNSFWVKHFKVKYTIPITEKVFIYLYKHSSIFSFSDLIVVSASIIVLSVGSNGQVRTYSPICPFLGVVHKWCNTYSLPHLLILQCNKTCVLSSSNLFVSSFKGVTSFMDDLILLCFNILLKSVNCRG